MANMSRGQRRPQTKITLDCQPAQAVGGGQFECVVTAIVADGNRAIAGTRIQFYVNSVAVGGTAVADQNGRVTQALRFAGTAGRNINVEAQIVGGATRSPATPITLPDAPQAPRSDKLSVRDSFDRNTGMYVISVMVADQKNDPRQNVPVILLLNGQRTAVRTDADGCAEFANLTWGGATIQVTGFESVTIELERVRPPVRPPAGTPFWQGLWFRICRNNNARLAAIWIFNTVFFLFNAFAFGFGPKKEYQLSHIKRNLYSVYENVSGIDLIPDAAGPESAVGSFLWKVWWICFASGIIYIPFALSDEVGRAISYAKRMATERKSQQDLPDPKQTTTTQQPGAGQPTTPISITRKFAVISDFFTALAAETLGRWVSRR